MITWEEKIEKIISCSTGDLRELANIAGQDPITFYRYQDLSMCDLRGQDLRGMDLTGTNIENATLDPSTKIDPEFDPRFVFDNEYVCFTINRDLNLLVSEFAKGQKYRYEAWAYKSLVDRSIEMHRAGRWSFYEDIIVNNDKFQSFVDNRSKSSLLTKTIQIYRHKQEYIHYNSEDIESFSMILMVGAISTKIRYKARKDFSDIHPLLLFRN